METYTKLKQIKNVAIYLRKSRGEDEDLERHEKELIDKCKRNGWSYVLFIEIGSSQITGEKLNEMMNGVESGYFQAVLVTETSRLGRNKKERGINEEIIMNNNVLIVTRDKIIDLNNTTDYTMSYLMEAVDGSEYMRIKQRMKEGKKNGAQLGNWTNGTPPFPYVYNPDIKGLEVDEDKNKIYRYMIDNTLDGMPFYEIAWELNKMGSRSPRGSHWHENTIRRIVIDETHLGRIISNKTSGSGHKKKRTKPLKKIPKDEWIIIENCHKALKTLEEHERMKYLLEKRRRIPVAARASKYPLSGIVRCGKCGSSMQFTRKTLAKDGKVVYLRKCQHADHYGNRCQNSGGNSKYIIEKIHEEIEKYEKELKDKISNNEGRDIKYLKIKIDTKLNGIEKKEKSIERIDLAFEEGAYGIDKYKSRIANVQKELDRMESELDTLQTELRHAESMKDEDRLREIQKFKEGIKQKNLSNVEQNKYYSRILDNVIWDRNDDDVEISINFL